MRLAVLLPSLKKKGPVILAFDLLKTIINKVNKIDVFYFSDCSDPYFDPDLKNINYIKISFFNPYSFSNYDVLHTHSFKPDLYSAIFKNKLSCRVITTVHNYVYEELYYTYNVFISVFLSRIWIYSWYNKDSIVFLSNNMKNYYLDRKLKNKNLHVISNGRNISSNDLKKDFCDEYKMILDLKLNHKIIGCCGVLNKRKGFQDLIKFLTFNPDLLAVFVGEGPDKKRLIKYANKLNVLNRCYFLGHQNNAISFINLFDFFVMSSYSEGFPLVVLEAGGVGVPILCVKTPLFQELFSDNDVVFYERNIDKSMLDSLNNILLHKNTYSLNIQNTIQNKYSSDLMAKKYFQLYERLNNN